MKTVALTGGIGMGKSSAAGMLQSAGVPVLDTDMLARQLVEPGQPALEEIAAAFGPEVLSPDGSLARAELAARVFREEAARQRLESILHPRIRRAWRTQVDAWSAALLPLAVVVIPLVYEVGAEIEFEQVWCVACSNNTQWRRLEARGWDATHIQQRLAAQFPIRLKMERADRVLWNEGNLGLLEAQLRHLLN